MTSTVNGTTDELVVVHVKDTINSILAGRGDVSYQSPPLPYEEAMKLVRMLLGRGKEFALAEERWTCPIAGGQRTVTLRPVAGVAADRSRRTGSPATASPRRPAEVGRPQTAPVGAVAPSSTAFSCRSSGR